MKRFVGLLLALFIGGTLGCVALDSEGVYRTDFPGNIGCGKEKAVLQERLAAAGFTLSRETDGMYIYADSYGGRTAVLVKDWRVSGRLPADWCAMECPASGDSFTGCPD